MAAAHRRINHMDRIKINGVWLTEEKDVREGVVNAFQHLLTENSDWKVITRLLVAWHVRVSTKFIPKVLTLK